MVYGKPSVFSGQPILNAVKIMKCQSLVEITEHYITILHGK